MPNICENTIQIEGNNEDINKFLSDTKSIGYEGRFNTDDKEVEVLDITKARPIPKVFMDITTGGATINGKKVSEWRNRNKKTGEFKQIDILKDSMEDYEQVAVSETELKELKENYGATNWYDWASTNWSTKWVTSVELENVHTDTNGEDTWVEFTCDSAWGPPEELLEYIANKYNLNVHDRWWEEGGNAGWIHIVDNFDDIEIED